MDRRPAASLPRPLTRREAEVLGHLAAGKDETAVIAGITITGDSLCKSTKMVFLDATPILGWLARLERVGVLVPLGGESRAARIRLAVLALSTSSSERFSASAVS